MGELLPHCPARGTPASALAEDSNKPVILVVSFGTSYNDGREAAIGAIEELIRQSFSGCEVRRAFTSRMVIDKLFRRDGLRIDDVKRAMEGLVAGGVRNVIVQPTHVVNGREYGRMIAEIAPYKEYFASIRVGLPLLHSAEDCRQLAKEVASGLPVTGEGEAVVFMGHGTEHFADAAYTALNEVFKDMGYHHVFVGTVEGCVGLDAVMRRVAEFGAGKVYLLPLMIVAGDHAHNDLAGDEPDSWENQFKNAGFQVECIVKGLGEYQGIREHFVRHVRDAMEGTQADS